MSPIQCLDFAKAENWDVFHLPNRRYFVKRIHNILQKADPVYGDRFSVDLELGLNGSSQSFRLSEHVFDRKLSHGLCFPRGMDWNFNATVYFILPVKDQARWVYHFINELTVASLLTGDKNFNVIVVDFESEDINLLKALNTSLLRTRHTVITLQGKFYKTLALNKAVEHVPSEHDIVFLFDLHIDVPVDIMDIVRKVSWWLIYNKILVSHFKNYLSQWLSLYPAILEDKKHTFYCLFLVFQNTIEGRLVYMPIVGRLECGSTYVDHRGYWETAGYGILSVYKSDWIRFGGKISRAIIMVKTYLKSKRSA